MQFSNERIGEEIVDLAMDKSNDFQRDKCGCRLSGG